MFIFPTFRDAESKHMVTDIDLEECLGDIKSKHCLKNS